MRELTIGKNDAGQRLDRFVSKSLPLLPPALLQKYIRLKRIKVNGKRLQAGPAPADGRRAAAIYQRRVLRQAHGGQPVSHAVAAEPGHRLRGREPAAAEQAAGPGGPRRRDGEGQHPHQPHPGVPLPEAGVEPALGERLHPGALQPHRPQHRRHRHRRQERGDAADHQREDPGPRDRQALPLHHRGRAEAAGGRDLMLPAQGRGEKAGRRLPPARSGRQDRRDALPDAGARGSCPCWSASC